MQKHFLIKAYCQRKFDLERSLLVGQIRMRFIITAVFNLFFPFHAVHPRKEEQEAIS